MGPDDSTTDRFHDIEAERAVLGGVLLNNATLAAVEALVDAAHFHHPPHPTIFEAMRGLAARRAPIDVVTLAAELRERQRLNTVGGIAYLNALTDTIPTTAHIESHAQIVRGLARKRAAERALADGIQRLRTGAALEEIRAAVALGMEDAGAAGGAPRVGADLDELFTTALARADGTEQPLPTPWPELNELLGGRGLWPGMYVVVGNTGAGKSQWAVQLAVAAARGGERVLYLALELARRDLAARVFGAVAGVAWSDLLLGRLPTGAIHDAIGRAERETRQLPLHTECGAPYGYGVETLVQRAWSLRPRLVVLDYLQVCGGRTGEDPRITVGRVSYVARAIARDLGAVVLVLSSTARANYEALTCGPEVDPSTLVGLGKESGEIEYAADGVLVLARDAQARAAGGRVLVVAKNRYGALGRVGLQWSGTAFAGADGAALPSPAPRRTVNL